MADKITPDVGGATLRAVQHRQAALNAPKRYTRAKWSALFAGVARRGRSTPRRGIYRNIFTIGIHIRFFMYIDIEYEQMLCQKV
jgi:hypothetical protein